MLVSTTENVAGHRTVETIGQVFGVVVRSRGPGAPTQVPPHAWERTSERFIDDESGQLLEVWVDPLTGERRYEPVAGDRQLPRP
jgi:hypothetical protein